MTNETGIWGLAPRALHTIIKPGMQDYAVFHYFSSRFLLLRTYFYNEKTDIRAGKKP